MYFKLKIPPTAADVDFVSTPLAASIPAGQNSTTVTVPILQDNVIEENEVFSLELDLVPIPQVSLAAVRTAIGIILDSTGMHVYQWHS